MHLKDILPEMKNNLKAILLRYLRAYFVFIKLTFKSLNTEISLKHFVTCK